ncbi:TniQ family protein [Phycicoccus sp. M110.8]|uniref:TniQ family protein n=1 Tax=Phycicoccus sp. M110.8 TaxID=3075433 RepID=UPI0028FD46AF|nr:TniQ family protein [Phycicoccus sp. M110.8]MDU0314112.1 TniQ family protein [Phycicoccus sp. M110.8]
MVDKTRLTLVVEPRPGEALWSWLIRTSSHALCPPGLVARRLGLPVRPQWRAGGARVACFGVLLPHSSAEVAAAVAGLSPAEIQQMHLSAYDGAALDLSGLDVTDERTLGVVARREWMLPFSTRACPACLSTAPVWPLWWRLQHAGCCPIHRLRLVDQCPACGIPFTRGYPLRARARALSDARIHDPYRCGNHTPDGPCAQVLADVPAEPVTHGQTVFQELVLSLAEPATRGAASGARIRACDEEGEAVLLGGAALTRAQWFDTLRDLSAVALCLAGTDPRARPRADPSSGPLAQFVEQWSGEPGLSLPTGYRSGPPTARACLALFDLVSAAMTASTRDSFAQAAGPLVRAFVDESVRRRHDPLRALPVRGLVARLTLDLRRPNFGRVVAPVVATRHVDFSGSGRSSAVAVAARFPTGAPVPAHAEDGRVTRWSVPAAWIPTLVPNQQYNEYIVEHLPGTATTTGRRFAALSVARLAGASTWADAGRALDLDRAASAHVADVVVRRVVAPDRYWRAVAAVLAELGHQGVDYRARARDLAHLHSIDPSTCEQLTPSRPTFDFTPARRRHAAAWVWAEHTGGPWTESPAALAPWPVSIDRASRVEGYRRFVDKAPRDLLGALIAWAASAKGPVGPCANARRLTCRP